MQNCTSPDRRCASRSRQTRYSNKTLSSPTLISQAAGEGILGQVDLSGFRPEDGLDLNFFPTASLITLRTTTSASPANYTTTQRDTTSMLAFASLGSQIYPPWPAPTGYDPHLSTTTHLMPSYAATTGPDIRPYIPPVFPLSGSHPSLSEPQHYGTYMSANDYSTLDPRFWPPTTQPGV